MNTMTGAIMYLGSVRKEERRLYVGPETPSESCRGRFDDHESESHVPKMTCYWPWPSVGP
jgi:hypothetical protein